MERKLCEIRECGAEVRLLEVAGKPLAVNPIVVEVVAGDPQRGFRLVSGFQPHYLTCVDITARHRRRAKLAGT